MKKKYNYIIYVVLLIVTVIITLLLSDLYGKQEVTKNYSYEKLNKISATEFNEYMMEHEDVIIYMASVDSNSTSKVEKKIINEIEKENLLEKTIFIEKKEITESFKKVLDKEYDYKYTEEDLPIIIIVIDGEVDEVVRITKNMEYKNAINYEAFK